MYLLFKQMTGVSTWSISQNLRVFKNRQKESGAKKQGNTA